MPGRGFDAEAFAATADRVEAAIAARQVREARLSPQTCESVDQALRRSDFALRELRASLKLMAPLLDEDFEQLGAGPLAAAVDLTTGWHRQLKRRWRDINPHKG
jgi:hypothetical protein